MLKKRRALGLNFRAEGSRVWGHRVFSAKKKKVFVFPIEVSTGTQDMHLSRQTACLNEPCLFKAPLCRRSSLSPR